MIEEQNNYYNSKLKQFAQKHRNNSTKAEIRIWCELLRNKKILGFQFLRQRSIENYIADFMCIELKLIIEIDGYSHQFKYEADIKRDKKLNQLGFHVMRFTNDDVKNHILNVERAIVQWIEETKIIIPLPPSKGDLTLFKKSKLHTKNCIEKKSKVNHSSNHVPL